MKTHSETNKLNRIEKRAIEALAVVPVIQAVAQRIGKEEALAILQEVNEKEAFQRGVRLTPLSRPFFAKNKVDPPDFF